MVVFMSHVTATTSSPSRVDGFDAVRDAFHDLFADPEEVGAALCVVVDGRVVVDVWGGHADRPRSRAWERDTVVNVFSAGKGALAIAAQILVDRDLLDLEAPVARYWPEFEAGDKSGVLVGHLLDHRAGLPALRTPLPDGSVFSWDTMVRRLAAEEPWWEPGTRHGYHPVTFGWLVGEVIRRTGGRRVRDFVRDEVSRPLGLGLTVGAGGTGPAQIAEVVEQSAGNDALASVFDSLPEMTRLAFANPPELLTPGLVNTAACRTAEIPAVNVHASARDLALLYAALADGRQSQPPLVSRAGADRLLEERVAGPDAVLGFDSRFGLGLMLPSALRPFGRGSAVAGHSGAGGSLGFVDADARLGFGFVVNRAIASGAGGDPRWAAITDAVYSCL
jgi:CubicO group peptidase (beta-lactamase class C family)